MRRPATAFGPRLRALDLNLLQVLHQLHLDRRVSVAAEHLDLSQPALSNALRRLRTALQDELFVRTPRGMEPTPFAEQLAGPVAEALRTLDDALTRHAPFDPATSERRFRIAMTDIGEIYFVPALIEALARRAPRCSMATTRDASALLRDGSIDLAVGLLPELPDGLFQRRLFRHHYVCLCRRGHPITRRAFTLEQFTHHGHVRVVAADTGHGGADAHLLKAGIRRDIRLEVPHFAAIGHILRDSDLLATVPERLATNLEKPFGLVSLPAPVPLPAFTIRMAWHARLHRDAAAAWLRDLMVELFAEAQAPRTRNSGSQRLNGAAESERLRSRRGSSGPSP